MHPTCNRYLINTKYLTSDLTVKAFDKIPDLNYIPTTNTLAIASYIPKLYSNYSAT